MIVDFTDLLASANTQEEIDVIVATAKEQNPSNLYEILAFAELFSIANEYE